ncbi:MAG TPA: PASTA domain-containing protein, partial [Acidimicrobiales bacterium]
EGEQVEQVTVPGVEGRTQDEATLVLRQAGFEVSVAQEASEEEAGRVVGQDPPAGEQADKGSSVEITVSSGPDAVAVPDVVGQTQDEASRILQDAGFQVNPQPVEDSDAPENTVAEQDPVAGTRIAPGSAVTIKVATGPSSVELPDVSGQPADQAAAALQGAGFQVQQRQEQSDEVEEGNVIRTEPGAGSQVAPGSQVTLVVSSGQGTVQVPRVEGLSEDNARAQLSQFEVNVVEQQTFNPALDSIVQSQNPGPGSQAEPGSEVTIVVFRFTDPEGPGGGGGNP